MSNVDFDSLDSYRDTWNKQIQRIQRYVNLQREVFHVRLALVQVAERCLPYGYGNVRAALYRWSGFAGIADKVYIHGRLDMRGFGNIYPRLRIGEHSSINIPCFIELNAPVRIGNHVAIGHDVLIITSNHEIGPAMERQGPLKPLPVTIEDGAWVGARVTILPGVTIGPGAMVAAGAVVTKDVPANTKVAGNPARVVEHMPPA